MTTKRLPAEERRKQLMKSAIAVFARATYHGATTKSIAEEAGVTEALIYRYFGSKRALFTASVSYTAERIARGIERALGAHEDPTATIGACMQYYGSLMREHPTMAQMFFLVLSELDEEDIRAAYMPHQDRVLELLGERLKGWETSGELAHDIPIEGGAWLWFGSFLLMSLAQHTRGDVPVDPGIAMALARPYFRPKKLDDGAPDPV